MNLHSRRRHEGVTEQNKASQHRMTDALALRDANRFRGAIYLAGYSVECLLKSKLMIMHRVRTLSELEDVLIDRELLASKSTIFTHQIELLLGLTGRLKTVRNDQRLAMILNKVNTWMPAWRYNSVEPSAPEANSFLEAAEALISWISNNT